MLVAAQRAEHGLASNPDLAECRPDQTYAPDMARLSKGPAESYTITRRVKHCRAGSVSRLKLTPRLSQSARAKVSEGFRCATGLYRDKGRPEYGAGRVRTIYSPGCRILLLRQLLHAASGRVAVAGPKESSRTQPCRPDLKARSAPPTYWQGRPRHDHCGDEDDDIAERLTRDLGAASVRAPAALALYLGLAGDMSS